MNVDDDSMTTTTPTTVCSVAIAADHPAFVGHFPGRPLLPGVALLAEIQEAARALPDVAAAIGATPHVLAAKFLGVVEPGATLSITFAIGERAVDWRVRDGERVVASGRFGRAATSPVGVRGDGGATTSAAGVRGDGGGTANRLTVP